MASLTFTVNTSGLSNVAKTLARRATKAEHIVAEQVQKDTEPYVPADTKTLANTAQVIGNTIIYNQPYARYLYYGKLMVDPVTGSSWAPEYGRKVLTDKDLVFKQTVNPYAQAHWFEASKAQNMDKWEKTAAEAITKYGEK